MKNHQALSMDGPGYMEKLHVFVVFYFNSVLFDPNILENCLGYDILQYVMPQKWNKKYMKS